ncbi:hypothetical protein RFI_10141 [Reticulomyxa filosa]|uniref:Uncharacterized protein n=1 Tax=Reticulomyxa filosa TaxID=46433 RepID=X6NLW6_RETFI|nr:hypothetical protein RFI_10141 [Reticulomyxa filosa]|eukprot:ETO26991.1 hypothetical protein RFI_10141 [Reticulomyxa filosa]
MKHNEMKSAGKKKKRNIRTQLTQLNHANLRSSRVSVTKPWHSYSQALQDDSCLQMSTKAIGRYKKWCIPMTAHHRVLYQHHGASNADVFDYFHPLPPHVFHENQSQVPSHTYFMLHDHKDEVLHCVFSQDGLWLLTASSDGMCLIYDLGRVLLTSPPLSISPLLYQPNVPSHLSDNCNSNNNNNNNNNNNDKTWMDSHPNPLDQDPIPLLCRLSHKHAVHFVSISANKHYVLTVEEIRNTFPDRHKHKHMRKEHASEQEAEPGEDEDEDKEKEEQVCCGAMVNLWQLCRSNHSHLSPAVAVTVVGKLVCKLTDYLREPSTCFTDDSRHFVVTAHHCNIDLFDTASGSKVMTLVHNTCYLFSHLNISNLRLFVTVNCRWIRVYSIAANTTRATNGNTF